MSKPKRKVCKCGWSGKTKANICPKPLCRSPLSMHRERNGRENRSDERVEPTPELAKRRKAGLYDLTIDCLLAKGVVNDAHLEAYNKFCSARETLYGKTAPATGSYGEGHGGKSDGPPDRALQRARSIHDLGLDALDCAGLKPKAALLHLYHANEALDIDCLLIGMDALVSAYREGQKITSPPIDATYA